MATVFGHPRVIAAPPGLGTLMGGPVVRDFGSAEQHLRLLPALANGAEGWCQLFSEPGAGSDLAGLRTRADKDGNEWIVNGQKVWTSGANHSRRGMLVARTNWVSSLATSIDWRSTWSLSTGVQTNPTTKARPGGSRPYRHERPHTERRDTTQHHWRTSSWSPEGHLRGYRCGLS